MRMPRGRLAVGAVVGDAGGAVDDIEVGVLPEGHGGAARAVQSQGVDDAVGGVAC